MSIALPGSSFPSQRKRRLQSMAQRAHRAADPVELRLVKKLAQDALSSRETSGHPLIRRCNFLQLEASAETLMRIWNWLCPAPSQAAVVSTFRQWRQESRSQHALTDCWKSLCKNLTRTSSPYGKARLMMNDSSCTTILTSSMSDWRVGSTPGASVSGSAKRSHLRKMVRPSLCNRARALHVGISCDFLRDQLVPVDEELMLVNEKPYNTSSSTKVR